MKRDTFSIPGLSDRVRQFRWRIIRFDRFRVDNRLNVDVLIIDFFIFFLKRIVGPCFFTTNFVTHFQ